MDQLQIEVSRAVEGGGGASSVAHRRSVTTGWRVASQIKSLTALQMPVCQIFAKGEQVLMSAEIIDCIALSLIDLNLLDAWIALE